MGNTLAQCLGSYGKKLFFEGDVSGSALMADGNQNHSIVVTSSVYSVVNTKVNLSGFSVCDSLVTNATFSLAAEFMSDHGFNTTLSFQSPTVLKDTTIEVNQNGGVLQYANEFNRDAISEVTIDKLHLKSGRLILSNYFYGGTNNIVIKDLVRDPGTLMNLDFATQAGTLMLEKNAGVYIQNSMNMVTGDYIPWAMRSEYLMRLTESGYLEPVHWQEYKVAPVETFDPTKLYRLNTPGEITLTQDSEIFAWLSTCKDVTDDETDDINIYLGDYDFTIGSGSFYTKGENNKTVSSTGGQMIFGGEDIILGAESTGTLEISVNVFCVTPLT